MATPVYRVRVLWTGFTGSPGYSSFYYDTLPVAADITALYTMFNSLSLILPNSVKLQVRNDVDTLDAETGAFLNTGVVGTLPASINGSGGTAFAGPTGAELRWNTTGVIHSRRVRGRTFLVPTAVIYDTDGTLTSTSLTTMQNAINTWTGSTGFHGTVWSRPFAGTPATATRPANPSRVGSLHPITSGTAVDKAVVLRSRRG